MLRKYFKKSIYFFLLQDFLASLQNNSIIPCHLTLSHDTAVLTNKLQVTVLVSLVIQTNLLI